jgi:hypothetical protein
MLKDRLTEDPSLTKTLALEGRLDAESVGILDQELDALLESAMKVLVFDLSKLEYIFERRAPLALPGAEDDEGRLGKGGRPQSHPLREKGPRYRKGGRDRQYLHERPGARPLPRRDAEESARRGIIATLRTSDRDPAVLRISPAPERVSITTTGAPRGEEVSDSVGDGVPQDWELAPASSWIARSAAVTVPAPAGPRRMTGSSSERSMGQNRHHESLEDSGRSRAAHHPACPRLA